MVQEKKKHIEFYFESKKQENNIMQLQKGQNDSTNCEPVTLYFYERRFDGSIDKRKFEAIEKKNSYELIDCWRKRLSKQYDINKYTDCLHHAMWADTENDELMEELLEYYTCC